MKEYQLPSKIIEVIRAKGIARFSVIVRGVIDAVPEFPAAYSRHPYFSISVELRNLKLEGVIIHDDTGYRLWGFS